MATCTLHTTCDTMQTLHPTQYIPYTVHTTHYQLIHAPSLLRKDELWVPSAVIKLLGKFCRQAVCAYQQASTPHTALHTHAQTVLWNVGLWRAWHCRMDGITSDYTLTVSHTPVVRSIYTDWTRGFQFKLDVLYILTSFVSECVWWKTKRVIT